MELPASRWRDSARRHPFLPGLRFDELRGTSYCSPTSYPWKLADIQPLMGQALYAGLLASGPHGWPRDPGELRHALRHRRSFNGRTPIGPSSCRWATWTRQLEP
jgi:hypothetical protein